MPIIASDIIFRLSGGATNSNPLLSLGGVKSNTAAASTIFDDVTSVEAAAGCVEHRLVYVHNAHATLSYLAAAVFISAQTPSLNTSLEIGLAVAGTNGTETAIAGELSVPAGVVFSAPSSFASGLSLGTLAPGQHYGVWLRRTVTAGAALGTDSFTLGVQGDTNP